MPDELKDYISGFTSHRIVVDYTKSADTILSEGNFDWVDKRINPDNFTPVFAHEGKKEIRLYLVKFQQGIFTEEVSRSFRNELRMLNFWPGTLWDAVALCTQYPHLQDDYSIVALGSPWKDAMERDHVPVLKRDKRGRSVRLDKAHFPWRKECRFLASLVK